MDRLIPGIAGEIDPFSAYQIRAPEWLRIGMVLSVDGSVTDDEGRSGGLGGAPDLRIFRTLRALADGILIGAGTVRDERYGPYHPQPELRQRRVAIGKAPAAPIVVVSRSLRLSERLLAAIGAPAVPADADADARADAGADSRVLVVTSEAAAAAAPLPLRPYLVTAGATEVDLGEAIRRLRTGYGLHHLLCEGGPDLAGQLVACGLADELCLTIAPTLIGAEHRTGLLNHLPPRTEVKLTELYHDDGVLFARYRLPRN